MPLQDDENYDSMRLGDELPGNPDARHGTLALGDGVWFAYGHLCRLGLGVVVQNELRCFQYQGLH